jgi:hypothetical protein
MCNFKYNEEENINKYSSVIMDCTVDICHRKQVSVLLRKTDVSSHGVQVEGCSVVFFPRFWHLQTKK